MTVLRSLDEGSTWTPLRTIDRGAVSYSALQIVPAAPGAASVVGSGSGSSSITRQNVLGLLYERSDNISIVFEPDQILYVPIYLHE